MRGRLVLVEPLAAQKPGERSLARCALTHEDDLDLRRFLGLAFHFGEVFADGGDALFGNFYGWGGEGVIMKD